MIASVGRTLARSTPRSFGSIMRYNYLTPIEKPITSLALNTLIEISGESMLYAYHQWQICPEISVMVGAFGFRLALEFFGLFFQSLSLKDKNSWIYRWIDKIFLVDLRRDVTFYELTPEKHAELTNYYKPEILFTSLLKSYTLLNFFRGGYYLITQPEFQSTVGTLGMHDGTFCLPIVVIGLNYWILSRSKHPFLINLVRPQNRLMLFNIAFMSGLILVPTPSIFSYSCIGLCSAHLFLRFIKQRTHEWRDYLRGFKNLLKRKK